MKGMKTKTIGCVVAVSAVLSLFAEPTGLVGIKSAGDAICSVSDSVTMSNGIALVDYVLKPEAECHIRCRITLPPADNRSVRRHMRKAVKDLNFVKILFIFTKILAENLCYTV